MACKVCEHGERRTIDKFLLLPKGTPGKRGPRSLARPFGLDRRWIAKHELVCLRGKDDENAA